LAEGPARREFAAFRRSMDESRERFDEVAPMIVDALGIRFIEGDGIFYPQSRTEIRPRLLPVIECGRELRRQLHGTTPPHVTLTEFVVCGPDLAACEEEARQYQGKFVESNFYHYEFLGEHFKTMKGYDANQQKAEIARKDGQLFLSSVSS
jgi:hypothetical protein